MYDLMLGPNGGTFWNGASPMPKSRFHMDWSRVAFLVGAQVDPLYAFSYGIGTQQPAAITAAIGATQADIFDTSITSEGTVSKTCILTHLGVTLDRMALINGGDLATSLANTRVFMPRLMIRTFWAERTNEEVAGLLEDFPEGIGLKVSDPTNATAWAGCYNGERMMSNIKPLPRPLPCKGGDTYIRVAFEPSVRDGGCTSVGVVSSLTARLYGVAPAKIQPGEAPRKALQALAALQG